MGEFTPIVLPCEGCGKDVPLFTSDNEDASRHWANGALTAWCPDCYPYGTVSL